MNKKEKLEAFRDFFDDIRAANARPGFLERIERFFTGATKWSLRRALEDRRLDRVLTRHDEFSFETKIQRDRCDYANLGSQFSYPLDKATRSRIAEERFAQLSVRDFRLLIANRIINPKNGGKYKVSMAKERVVLSAGWAFVLLCATAFCFTTATVWLGPAGLMLKMILTLFLMATFFLFAYSMSCYGILPFRIVKQIE